MSVFDQALPSFRLVETYHGDDIEAVASRYLGDANLWYQIAWINNLVWPYLTDNPDLVATGILLTGSFIKVPAATGVYTQQAEAGQVYERDCELMKGQLQIKNGDLAVLTGAANLKQQLKHRIDTPMGQLRRHPEYGCSIYRLKGKKISETTNMLGAEYVKAALLGDYRVDSVNNVTATVTGDVLRVAARAVAIEGGAVDIVTG